MGVSNSKQESCEALRLCKERKKFIKKAIDSRYDFAAAHCSYLQSLHNLGISLRRFSEAYVLLDPCGTSGGAPPESSQSKLSYMRSSGTNAVTVSVKPARIDVTSTSVYVDDGDSMSFTMPLPPPPPPPESGSGWDYFDPPDVNESFRFVGHDGFHVNFSNMSVHKEESVKESDVGGGFVRSPETVRNDEKSEVGDVEVDNEGDGGGVVLICRNSQTESNKDSCLTEGDREDAIEFITHRAKDFLSSIRDIESRFFRASECGKEVSRMLEADKIRVGYSEAKGGSSASSLLCANCCIGKTALVSHEPLHVTKVITWKRSTSSHSSSSRNPLAPTSKEDNDDSGSDFMEEFCMIAGSHSSTLDRLYAWERKLYDEVKASESIRKEYDKKCDQLRHQFAKDLKTHMIDKTRSLVKDLHSRIIVALHTVDSISKRIEKMRDEELQPQLLELIQGLNRMWKAMLECHHAQYITISLAYHLKKSNNGIQQDESKKQIMDELQGEIECFGLSFTNMVNSQTSYVESINNWLQNCIIQPKERLKKRALSPRRYVAPPMFVICRDWSSGIQTLPAQQLSDAIKAFLSHLHEHSLNEFDQKPTNLNEDEKVEETMNANETPLNLHANETPLNLQLMHSSLSKVLDGLTKFSEASLKMYEDIKLKSETAKSKYSNYRPPLRASSI